VLFLYCCQLTQFCILFVPFRTQFVTMHFNVF
jgi:hypothetical protein